MTSNSFNGVRSFIAAIIHQFSLYPLFMMSNIIPFMISYLYHIQKESSPDNKSSLTQNDGYFIHPIMELIMSICCFFGGIVEHYLGPRLVILIGGFCIALGDLLFIVSRNLIFYFFINIFFGIGFAISMTAAVKNATKYYPAKAGLINAVAGGFGGNLGSSFFNLIIKYCVSKGDYPNNEDNDMYKKSTAQNYKIFFYIHGGIAIGFAIISSILLVPFKNEVKAKLIENAIEETEKEEEEEKEKEKNKNYKSGLKLIFSKIRIYKLLFIFLFTSFLQGFIFTVGFNFGTMDHGNDKKIGGDDMRWGVYVYAISIILNGCINGGAFSMIFPYVSKIYGFIYKAYKNEEEKISEEDDKNIPLEENDYIEFYFNIYIICECCLSRRFSLWIRIIWICSFIYRNQFYDKRFYLLYYSKILF